MAQGRPPQVQLWCPASKLTRTLLLLLVLLQVTILFSDIVGFTELCSLWPTQEVVAMLDMLFSAFDDLCDK
jgi:class 3 adenylate cyclase